MGYFSNCTNHVPIYCIHNGFALCVFFRSVDKCTVHVYHIHSTYFLVGVGTGERDKNQRVNVDDGTEAVGAVDYLVHQTVHFSLYL